MTASEGFSPNTPFNELPPLPPAGLLETRPVLKAVIEARAALSALNTACDLIPNPEIINSTIPLREAQASTEIENIVTTNDELFKAEWMVDKNPSPATKEALRYKTALYAGMDSLTDRPVSEKTAVLVCSILNNQPARIRSTPGTYIGDPLTKNGYIHLRKVKKLSKPTYLRGKTHVYRPRSRPIGAVGGYTLPV